jgi:hypothetical protein
MPTRYQLTERESRLVEQSVSSTRRCVAQESYFLVKGCEPISSRALDILHFQRRPNRPWTGAGLETFVALVRTFPKPGNPSLRQGCDRKVTSCFIPALADQFRSGRNNISPVGADIDARPKLRRRVLKPRPLRN